MKQVAQTYRTGELTLREVPAPSLQPGGVLVETWFSVVSVGTEGMKVQTARKSLLGKARARPELVRQVLSTLQKEGLLSTYRKVMNRLDAPVPLGYSLCGRVLAVAPDVEDLTTGDVVACAGAGYANHAEIVFVPKNLCVKVPPEVPADLAAFTTVGAIALQGVRQAEVQVGDAIAVVGLGLVGQLAVQLLSAAGCRVFGIDINAARAQLARELGAQAAFAGGDDTLEQAALSFSRGLGMDSVLVCAATRSNDAVNLAARLARDRGRVVIVGIVGMDIHHEAFYEKELDLRMSRSYGPGRYDPVYEEEGVDYPAGYVRWTERRNMEAVLDLMAAGRLKLAPLITHRFPFAQAAQAYELIAGPGAASVLGVVFEYDRAGAAPAARVEFPSGRADQRPVNLGVIGAGNFAKTMLLPHLKERSNVSLRGVATATALSAQDTAGRFGFAFAATDAREVLEDAATNAVLIATRHNLHAPLAAQALRAGKAVFVEKPLALNEVELADVMDAYRHAPRPFLMVGFNRRFAPLVTQARGLLPKHGPYTIHCRVNAGFTPLDSWYQDPIQGGGRLLGEGCHFIDLLLHLTGARPLRVSAAAMDDAGVYRGDNVAVTVSFADGSVGTLLYVACGDPAQSKERLEIFSGGAMAVLDDYRSLQFSHGGKSKTLRSRLNQDKGHAAEMAALVAALATGGPAPIPAEELFLSTLATLCAARSLREQRPVEVDLSALLAASGQ